LSPASATIVSSAPPISSADGRVPPAIATAKATIGTTFMKSAARCAPRPRTALVHAATA
jgi:hypothetical protein